MRLRTAKTKRTSQSGAALLLCLLALLLLSSIGIFLYISTGTETRIAANYGNNLDAYYAAKSGLAEVRDRVSYPSDPTSVPSSGGLADKLPQAIAGNTNGVLYVINRNTGETVDPTDSTNKYFDDQLCHDFNSGVAAGSKCTSSPATPNWALPVESLLAPAGTESALKWVRINMKTNRVVLPNYCINQACSSAPLDTPVCWDGQTEQVSPGGTVPACDANGMQNVYMLTSLAITPGLRDNSAHRLLRSEVVAPSIRPPGAITADAASISASLTDSSSTAPGIPGTAVDGRPHKLDGTLAGNHACSAVAALATDSPSASSQVTQSLDSVRKGIVDTANASCNWDGSGVGSNVCTPGLWWVRGTNSTPRFVTSITTTTTTVTSGSGSNSSGPGSGDDHHVITTTTTSACDPSSPSCYTNLDISSPELFATDATMAPQVPSVTWPPLFDKTSPITGGPGNQGSVSMYQSPLPMTLPDEVSALNKLISASVNQPNYFQVSAANLASSYGSSGTPAIVVITDINGLVLNQNLSGYGILVVTNDLEINAQFQWTGIVLVKAGNAQFKVGSSGTGSINGALMLQPATASAASLVSNTVSTKNTPIPFRISYSCEAIDMAFGSLPYKILGSSEVSF